jgi:hypothetical protein
MTVEWINIEIIVLTVVCECEKIEPQDAGKRILIIVLFYSCPSVLLTFIWQRI